MLSPRTASEPRTCTRRSVRVISGERSRSPASWPAVGERAVEPRERVGAERPLTPASRCPDRRDRPLEQPGNPARAAPRSRGRLAALRVQTGLAKRDSEPKWRNALPTGAATRSRMSSRTPTCRPSTPSAPRPRAGRARPGRARDAAQQAGDQPAVGDRVVGGALVGARTERAASRSPSRRGRGCPRPAWPRRTECSPARWVRRSRIVTRSLPRRRIRPVRGDGLVVVQLAAVGEPVHDRGGDALARREADAERCRASTAAAPQRSRSRRRGRRPVSPRWRMTSARRCGRRRRGGGTPGRGAEGLARAGLLAGRRRRLGDGWGRTARRVWPGPDAPGPRRMPGPRGVVRDVCCRR